MRFLQTLPLFLLFGCESPSAPGHGLHVSAKVVRWRTSVGTPVEVTVVVKNFGSDSVEFWRSGCHGPFDVFDARGTWVGPVEGAICRAGPTFHVVAPGGSVTIREAWSARTIAAYSGMPLGPPDVSPGTYYIAGNIYAPERVTPQNVGVVVISR